MNICVSKENKRIDILDHFWRRKQSKHISLSPANILTFKLLSKSVSDLGFDKDLNELIHSLQISNCFGSKNRRHHRTENTGSCNRFQIKSVFSVPIWILVVVEAPGGILIFLFHLHCVLCNLLNLFFSLTFFLHLPSTYITGRRLYPKVVS